MHDPMTPEQIDIDAELTINHLPANYVDSELGRRKTMLEILNLGGGVQSSRLLEESIAGDLPRLDAALFADTVWEPKAVYDHVAYLTDKARLAGIPVYRVEAGDVLENRNSPFQQGDVAGDRKPHLERVERHGRPPMPFARKTAHLRAKGIGPQVPGPVVDPGQFLWLPEDETDAWMQREATKLRAILASLKIGKPYEQRGMIKRQCTSEYKIEPIERFIKTQLLGLDSKARWPKECVVRQWFGISADEARRCRAARAAWKVHWYPLVDRLITRIACYGWFEERGLLLPPRSACIGCPFHSDAEWRSMKLLRPDEWADACQFDYAIRKCGGMRGDCYLHRTCQPLADVDLSTDVDRGQMLLVGIDDPQLLSCESGHCFM